MSRFWRNLAALGFGLLLGGAASLSYAVGTEFAGHCYSSTNTAIDAFASTFPQYDNGRLYSLNEALPGSIAGMVDYQTFYSTGAGTYVYEEGSVLMPICSKPTDTLALYKTNDILFISACVFSMFIGISVGMKR